MQYKGQLLLPDDTGPGLKVSLDVAAHHLAVESDDGGLGAWPLEVVDVERLEGDIFAITVAGEPLRFVADDTIAFAYSGVPTIEQFSSRRTSKGRSSFRSMLERIWNGPVEPEETALAGSASDEDEQVDEVSPKHAPPPPADPSPVPRPPADAKPAVVDVAETDRRDDTSTLHQDEAVVEDLPGQDLAVEPGCPAIRGDGRRCESPILTSSGYCYPHDPKRAFEDRYQAAQEARAQLKRDATGRLNRIYSRLDKAMRQVERGELDPETAMAMAQIANTMCAILGIDESSEDTRD